MRRLKIAFFDSGKQRVKLQCPGDNSKKVLQNSPKTGQIGFSSETLIAFNSAIRQRVADIILQKK